MEEKSASTFLAGTTLRNADEAWGGFGVIKAGRPFVVVPVWLLFNRRLLGLTMAEVTLILGLKSIQGGDVNKTISTRKMSNLLGVDARQLGRQLNKLKDKGLLKRVHIGGNDWAWDLGTLEKRLAELMDDPEAYANAVDNLLNK